MVLFRLTRRLLAIPNAIRIGLWTLIFRKKRMRRVDPASKLPIVGLDERVLQSILVSLRQAPVVRKKRDRSLPLSNRRDDCVGTECHRSVVDGHTVDADRGG